MRGLRLLAGSATTSAVARRLDPMAIGAADLALLNLSFQSPERLEFPLADRERFGGWVNVVEVESFRCLSVSAVHASRRHFDRVQPRCASRVGGRHNPGLLVDSALLRVEGSVALPLPSPRKLLAAGTPLEVVDTDAMFVGWGVGGFEEDLGGTFVLIHGPNGSPKGGG